MNRSQSTPVGSIVSKMLLIELIAVTMHAIAVHIFKQVDGGLYTNDKYPDAEFYGDLKHP